MTQSPPHRGPGDPQAHMSEANGEEVSSESSQSNTVTNMEKGCLGVGVGVRRGRRGWGMGSITKHHHQCPKQVL